MLHNKECLRKHSPVIFIAPVILMEVLNVVVDQNRTLNPETKRRGRNIISLDLREYVALVTVINKVLPAWATVAALCVVDHHLCHHPGLYEQGKPKHSKGNCKLAR